MRTNRSPFALVIPASVALIVVTAAAFAAAYLLRPRIATPVSGCPTPGADTFDDLLKCGTKLYSQYNEELIIRQFFRDRRDGVFVDVGASHYKNNSTTYYLEHHLNWSGVAVDALADYGPDYERFRPKTRFSAYIVTDHSGALEPFYKLHKKFLMSTVSKEWMEGSGDEESTSCSFRRRR